MIMRLNVKRTGLFVKTFKEKHQKKLKTYIHKYLCLTKILPSPFPHWFLFSSLLKVIPYLLVLSIWTKENLEVF
jgi:hypothetical protein